MTETFPTDPSREYDEKDVLAQKALADMQDIVDRFMRAANRSVDEMTDEEKDRLAREIDPHLKFELSVSEGVNRGMPLEISGRGAFLALSRDNKGGQIQATYKTDLMTGTISRIEASPVPSKGMVLAANPHEGGVEFHEESMSAILILENAIFRAEPNSDGTYDLEHDFSNFIIVIPLIYGMECRVADISK